MTDQTAAVVRLTHPDTKTVVEALPEHVARYTSQGWREATPDAPSSRAKLADWQAFARSKGFTDEDIAGKTIAELRAALS